MLSVFSPTAQAKSIVLNLSSKSDTSSRSLALQSYESLLIEGITAVSGDNSTIITSSSAAASSQQNNSVHLYSNVIRTPENEQEYYWITPVAAFPCDKATQQCSSNVVENKDVSLSYIVLPKKTQYQDLAEQLALSASEFKVSQDFASLSSMIVDDLSSDDPNVVFSYGILSFVGALPADTDNLWVISDLVPLFSEVGERGEVKGLAVDFVNSVLSDVGMSPTILFAPWQRIAKESITKSNVLVFSIAHTEEREHLFHWITPISRNLHGLFGVNQSYYDNFDDVPRTLRIGGLKNDYRIGVAASHGFFTQSYDSWDALVSAVFDKQIDAIFASQGAIDFACDVNKQPCETIEQIAPYQISSAYLALSKRETSLVVVEKLKLASARIKRSDEFRQTANKWSEMVNEHYHFAHYIENGVVHLWKKQQ